VNAQNVICNDNFGVVFGEKLNREASMKGNILACVYQEGIRVKRRDISEQFPSEFEHRPDLHLLQIITDDDSDLVEILSGCPLTEIAWLGFTTKNLEHNVFGDSPINSREIKLSWYKKRLLNSLGPLGNEFKHLNYFTGKFQNVIPYSIDDDLWGEGVAVVLPVLQPIDEILEYATNVQLKKKFSTIVLNIFNCVLIANFDGSGGSFIWYKDWVYSNDLSSWAKCLKSKYKLEIDYERCHYI
jgi:hypothetical protein